MIEVYGVNFAIQECKTVFALFQLKADDEINVCDFLDTWSSKHEILLENTIQSLFNNFDPAGKGCITIQ